MKGAPLISLLLALGICGADARVRLGEMLPPHPWESKGRELVVVYTHDCGDLGDVWRTVLNSGMPVRAVNVTDQYNITVTPKGLKQKPWRGEAANKFAKALKVGQYPAVILVNDGRILNAWEGNFKGKLTAEFSD